MQYTYEDAVNFFQNLPHFVPPKSSDKPKNTFSLDAELALLNAVGNPQEKLSYVHIAGTNGKGSTTAYLANILKSAGLKIGAFTSPYLYRYNEMYRVNGREISEEAFARIFARVKPAYDTLATEGIHPSEYEILTVMAFLYFQEEGCELVLLEVSLGGRTDTTNVIPAPRVAVMTPISYDHMSILGNTLSAIATEKAGIIKPGCSVVSAPQEREVLDVLTGACSKLAVPFRVATQPTLDARSLEGQRFYVGKQGPFETTLLGTYQLQNAATAIAAANELRDLGYDISEEAIARGVAATRWFGRFTIVAREPITIIDGGHNRQGADVLRASIEAYFPGRKVVFVLGLLADKEIDEILTRILPVADRVYTIAVPSPRTMDPKVLAKVVCSYGVKAMAMSDVKEVRSMVAPEEILCFAGSLYSIAGYEFPEESEKPFDISKTIRYS